ncbi:MAG: Rieske (2Fe-2S) protein [Actinobacteria bacterium]|nr:Rieske (2Fe-2S) protein [Actinomycetota bacterium]
MEPAQVGPRADTGDARAVDEHRAVVDHRARGVHRDDAAPAHEEGGHDADATLRAVGAILCDNAALRNRWHAVARSNEVVGTPIRRTLLGTHVVLWRDAGHRVSALPDRCSHREAKLSLGTVKDGCIECPYHGWQFAADGTCTHVPSATPGVPVPPKAHLAPYRATEKFGLVWVCLGEPAAPLPDVAQDADPSFRRINTDLEVWRTSATRMADTSRSSTSARSAAARRRRCPRSSWGRSTVASTATRTRCSPTTRTPARWPAARAAASCTDG